jgi:hypothetical protein
MQASNAQTETFQKLLYLSGDEIIRSMACDDSGSFVLSGRRQNLGMLMLKFSHSGNPLWSQYVPNLYVGWVVFATANGTSLIVEASSNTNVLIVNSAGDVTYSKNYSSLLSSSATMLRDGSGYALVGIYTPASQGFYPCILKLNTDGDSVWLRGLTYLPRDYYAGGIDQTHDGGYIILAYKHELKFMTLFTFPMLIRTNPMGDTLWTRSYDSLPYSMSQFEVQSTADGGYIVAGSFYDETGARRGLLKVDSVGNTAWARGRNMGQSVRETPDGGYIFVDAQNLTTSTSRFTKLNSAGDELWSRLTPLNSYGGVVRLTADGGYVAAGNYYSRDSGYFVYIMKTDANGLVTGVADQSALLPTEFRLEQNYPNPFNPSTVIRYSIPGSAGRDAIRSYNVTLKIFNTLGQEIATLVDEQKQPGSYEAVWNAEGVPSGVYFYRLSSDSFQETKKLLLIR